jgi:hypothetical protein
MLKFVKLPRASSAWLYRKKVYIEFDSLSKLRPSCTQETMDVRDIIIATENISPCLVAYVTTRQAR